MKLEAIGAIEEVEDGFVIKLSDKFKNGLTSIEGFSFLNIFWWADQSVNEEYEGGVVLDKPYTKEPEKIGVFATRSQIRPNPICVSIVYVIKVNQKEGMIYTPYIDAYPGTPILDIKPYLPATDVVQTPSVPEWCSHWPKNYEESALFDWQAEFNF